MTETPKNNYPTLRPHANTGTYRSTSNLTRAEQSSPVHRSFVFAMVFCLAVVISIGYSLLSAKAEIRAQRSLLEQQADLLEEKRLKLVGRYKWMDQTNQFNKWIIENVATQKCLDALAERNDLDRAPPEHVCPIELPKLPIEDLSTNPNAPLN